MSALILIPEPYPLFIPLRNEGLPRKIAEDCSVSNKWWKEIWTADVKFSYLENVKRSVEIRKGGEREEEEEEGGGGEGERKDARATGHGNKFDNNKEKHFTWSRNRFAEFVAGQDLLERDDTLCFSLASCPWQRWFFYSNWIEKRILVESLLAAPRGGGGLLSCPKFIRPWIVIHVANSFCSVPLWRAKIVSFNEQKETTMKQSERKREEKNFENNIECIIYAKLKVI